MTTDYPITKTQHALIAQAAQKVEQAQAALNLVYSAILGAHDVTTGQVTAVSETTLTVSTDGEDGV